MRPCANVCKDKNMDVLQAIEVLSNNKFSQVYQRKMEDAYQCTICKCNAKLYTDNDGVFIKAVGGHIPKDVNINSHSLSSGANLVRV